MNIGNKFIEGYYLILSSNWAVQFKEYELNASENVELTFDTAFWLSQVISIFIAAILMLFGAHASREENFGQAYLSFFSALIVVSAPTISKLIVQF